MFPHQNKHHNLIAAQRRKYGYSQRHVARLLGQSSHASLSAYERGAVLPTLPVALRLEIILKTPVRILFPRLTADLENEVDEAKKDLPGYGQQVLFEDP